MKPPLSYERGNSERQKCPLGMHMVSVYVWMYKNFLSPKLSLSLGMCCTAGIRGDGVCCGSCNRAHLSLSLYLCRPRLWAHGEGRWERGKEGGRHEQECLCKAPGHSMLWVLWHPTPHNGAPLRLQERSLGNTEGKWVSTTLQSHIKFTVMASAGSHAAWAWARTSPQIHPNPLFSHTIKGSGLWLYKLIWCKPTSRSQRVVVETLLESSRHYISDHLLHLDPPANMNYHMYFLADGDFKSVWIWPCRMTSHSELMLTH